jgi:hypothetical protein
MARHPAASRGPSGFLPSHRVERGWRGQVSFRPRRRTSIRRPRRPGMVPTLGRTTRGPRRPPVPVEDRAPPAVEDPRIPNGRPRRSLRRDQRGIPTPLLPVPIARQQAQRRRQESGGRRRNGPASPWPPDAREPPRSSATQTAQTGTSLREQRRLVSETRLTNRGVCHNRGISATGCGQGRSRTGGRLTNPRLWNTAWPTTQRGGVATQVT